MFGIGIRHDSRRESVLAGFGVLALLVGMGLAREPVQREEVTAVHGCRYAMRTAPLTADEARMAADAAYRAGDFERAAELVASVRPTDVDLQNLALQYERMARTWSTAMDPWAAHVTDAFPALRELTKLDLVLGGAHQDAITDRMRAVAPRAAHAFMVRRDYPNAELALHTAEMLGVRSEQLAVVGEVLAGHTQDRAIDPFGP
jgi:hypothetical protein